MHDVRKIVVLVNREHLPLWLLPPCSKQWQLWIFKLI